MQIINKNLQNKQESLDLGKLDGPLRLWATTEELMRAIDYRTIDHKNMILLVLKSFSSTRAKRQGLGRVGRNND